MRDGPCTVWHCTMGFLTAGLLLAGIAIADPVIPVHIRGDIVSHIPGALMIHRRSGATLTLDLGPNIPIAAVRKMSVADIRIGSYIGTAAKTNKQGEPIAQAVILFSESARGTGEGHHAWDLGSQSSMTNANVDAISRSANGSELKLSFGGGSYALTVPSDAPILTFVPAEIADLTAGQQVFAVATMGAANRYIAQRIVVEKNGVLPPM
jgi:hypothetical protein